MKYLGLAFRVAWFFAFVALATVAHVFGEPVLGFSLSFLSLLAWY